MYVSDQSNNYLIDKITKNVQSIIKNIIDYETKHYTMGVQTMNTEYKSQTV